MCREFDALVPLPDLPRFHGGAVGYLVYEVMRHFEDLPSPPDDPLSLPEALFMFTDSVVVFDHLTHKIKVVSHAHLEGDVEEAYSRALRRIDSIMERLSHPVAQEAPRLPDAPSTLSPNLSQAEFEERVLRARDYIHAGELLGATAG